MTDVLAEPRKRDSHIWAREANEHYVEPAWCSRRLFEEEPFRGAIDDPCCGIGTIMAEAFTKGFGVSGGDIVVHGHWQTRVEDFLQSAWSRENIVCNPPFNIANHFALHALALARRKVAMIFPTARLNAAHWIEGTPLRRVWLLSPRPSMPPGHVIAAGGRPQGGRVDFCWLVWEQGYSGTPELRWLYREPRP